MNLGRWERRVGIRNRKAPVRRVATTFLVLIVLSGPLTGSPRRVAAAAGAGEQRRLVWVALEGANKIVKVDVDRSDVLGRRGVPGAPHNLTVSPSGNTVATTLWSGGSVVLRRSGDQRSVALGGSPHDVKIAGGRVVVTNQTQARLDILGTTGTRRRSIALKADPHDVALRWRGRQAWVSLEGSDDLAIVGVRSGRVRYVSTGKAPHDLLFAPDGKLWVTDWAGAIHVFSRRGRRVKTIPLGVEAHHLDFIPNGRQAWITDHAAHRVFVVTTTRYKVLKRFGVRGAPHHIAITSDGERAVVADHDRGLLLVYDVDDLRRVRGIPVGRGPHGIWSAP